VEGKYISRRVIGDQFLWLDILPVITIHGKDIHSSTTNRLRREGTSLLVMAAPRRRYKDKHMTRSFFQLKVQRNVRDEGLPMVPGIEYLQIEKNGATTEMTDGLEFFLGRFWIRGYHQLHQPEQLVDRLLPQ